MIRRALVQAIRDLYDRGYLKREIMQRLGIDGFTYSHAVKSYWKTAKRRRAYGRRSRHVCQLREQAAV